MSLETFEQSLNFLERSGINQARLLGGEPTIHPDFCRMVEMVLARGLYLFVFSGGLIPNRALRKLEQTPKEKTSLLINVVPPEEGRPSEIKRQTEVFRCLNQRIIPGLNICSPSAKLDFLLDLIEKYDLSKRIRLGLAQPIFRGANEFLHPKYYPEVGRLVAEFGRRAQLNGVAIEFDCGWVPCMFPEGALDFLAKSRDNVGPLCIPMLDVLPNGQVISCYAMASHAAYVLSDDKSASQLRAQFQAKQKPLRTLTLYQKCAVCNWRAEGRCCAGCLAGAMRRFTNRPFFFSESGQFVSE